MFSPKGFLLPALLVVVLAAPAAHAADPASVKVTGCSGAERTASFTGRMETRPGARRMDMRFTLQERFGAGAFAPVSATGLHVWRHSKRRARVFSFTQDVMALRGGGHYRALVEFRWVDRRGRGVKSTRRLSELCRQPGDPPNLQVGSVVTRSMPGGASYSVEVLNSGGSVAQRFDLALTVDGLALAAQRVVRLAPGERRGFSFSGPHCTRELRAAVDPRDAVKESLEDDNVFASSCPVPSQ